MYALATTVLLEWQLQNTEKPLDMPVGVGPSVIFWGQSRPTCMLDYSRFSPAPVNPKHTFTAQYFSTTT